MGRGWNPPKRFYKKARRVLVTVRENRRSHKRPRWSVHHHLTNYELSQKQGNVRKDKGGRLFWEGEEGVERSTDYAKGTKLKPWERRAD